MLIALWTIKWDKTIGHEKQLHNGLVTCRYERSKASVAQSDLRKTAKSRPRLI